MMRKISKLVVFYNDGTYEELVGTALSLGLQAGLTQNPAKPGVKCPLCNGYHGGIQCPYTEQAAGSEQAYKNNP